MGEDREAEVQAAIFEGLRLDGPSADVVNNPGRHHMETQPPIVRLSRSAHERGGISVSTVHSYRTKVWVIRMLFL